MFNRTNDLSQEESPVGSLTCVHKAVGLMYPTPTARKIAKSSDSAEDCAGQALRRFPSGKKYDVEIASRSRRKRENSRRHRMGSGTRA